MKFWTVLRYFADHVALVYILDFLTAFIIEKNIASPSIMFMFKLYYALTHQIYVRNLYARLRSPQQFAVIQGASSFVTIFIAPTIMMGFIHRFTSWLLGTSLDLPQYRRSVARGFYLKSWAANTTMAAFLGWCTIIHFGPNRLAYPYFDFTRTASGENLYSWQLTFTASSVVWFCELFSAAVARFIIERAFSISIEEEMQSEFANYPDLLPAGTILTIFVLMNMLSMTSSISESILTISVSTVRLSFHQ